jgi:polysaccharide pyruvyl transferase WcaK-like protein
MKIGILTIHDSPNYGACLQCYALWKYLAEQGYDCEIIDLHRPIAHSDYIPSKRYHRCRPLSQSWISKLKKNVKKLLGIKSKPIKYYNDEAKKKFEEFNSLYKKSAPYTSIDAFYKNPPQYDIYIAGSDQLWNPTQHYCIEPYFLTFVSGSEKKKISFSTSIGITELTDDEKKMFKEWLNDFTAISVREKQAKQLLESFVGREVNQISDPTFLLSPSSWHFIANAPTSKEPYILYFALHFDKNLLNYCQKLSKESGLCLYVLNQTQSDSIDNSYIAIKDAGPRDFLGYIENAEMVITDSFHGTVFSLIMGAKNFYTHISPRNKRGSRIEDLLETYALKNHILREDLSRTYLDLQKDIVERQQVIAVINRERTRSIDYLKSVVEEK